MYDNITSRAVMGMYFAALEADPGLAWLDKISNLFNSDQASETYAFLGQVPALRQWIGGRNAKTLRENSLTITNVHYEATLDILLKDLRRDKTPQIRARIAEFVQRGASHFASLVSTDIINGTSTVCYDGQYFFDTDHSEGDSGTQSNDITTDISALPAAVHGAVTAPSPEEMQQAILKSIAQMLTFVDDQGEPINESANAFHVMVPVGLSNSCRSALSVLRQSGPGTFDMDGFQITASVNPRLTSVGSWTDAFVTFRTDGSVKPLIRQRETLPQVKLKDEESEYAFDNDAIQIGIDTWCGTSYGMWQGAVYNQMV